ncbi:MAG: nucleotidyltransferase domain-containing protein [Promethearchaeota archaeon]
MKVKFKFLPEHYRIYTLLYNSFVSVKSIIGIFLSGSSATGKMDKYSDIDIGIVFDSITALNTFWDERWKWDVPSWFHRFDADHIKKFFVIYFFEPNIKVDIALYFIENLPPFHGAPYYVVYDPNNRLKDWSIITNKKSRENIDNYRMNLADIIHDDERFWAWLFYSYQHIARGEYYKITTEFEALRQIIENWYSYFVYKTSFTTKYFEFSKKDKFLNIMKNLFPIPDKESLLKAFRSLIAVYQDLRELVESEYSIIWKINKKSIDKIKTYFNSL